MAIMMSALYDALRKAGADEDSARKAAEEGAAHENRFARLEGEMLLLKWMVGFNIALSVGILAKLLT